MRRFNRWLFRSLLIIGVVIGAAGLWAPQLTRQALRFVAERRLADRPAPAATPARSDPTRAPADDGRAYPTPIPTETSRPYPTPLLAVDPPITPPAIQHQLAIGELRVHFIDVGQGDAMLLEFPDGTTALIDGGPDNGRALAFLRQRGIGRINVMIATHPHADHIGGLVEVLEALPVDGIWMTGASNPTGVFERLLDAIDARRVPYHEVGRGDRIPLGRHELVALRGQPEAANLNDTSLVLRLQYDEIVFLFTGDAEGPSEQAMLASDRALLGATILKVGHHGSHTSSSPAFLEAVGAKIAVYSAGRSNQYGHPHAETLANLEAAGAVAFGTDQYGTVTISSDGASFEIATERSGGALPTPTSGAPGGALRYDPAGPDRDCGDFASHAEALAFFQAGGGPQNDRHRLDGDGDGVPCESLP
ncbi:MAG TPA: MBL fold metallo-hydrolase [Herpetosiphonaceae bacterium]